MPLTTGVQRFNKLGAAFMFKPDDQLIAGVVTPYPWFDAGTLTERTPKIDNMGEEVMDDRDGAAGLVYYSMNGYKPTYDLTTQNTAASMFALYYRATFPTAFTQSATTITDAAHVAWPGTPMKLVNGTGVGQIMVASVTNVKIGSTPLVRGVDYDYTPGDLRRGFVYILPTSTLITAPATAVTATFVLQAITTGGFTIAPLSGPCSLQGIGEMHIAACEGQTAGVISGYYSIEIPEMSWPVDKLASTKLTVRQLKRYGTNTPNGTVTLPQGF